MDIDTISTFISSVGFPIAAFCACFYELLKVNDAYRENTKILAELKTMIEVIREDLEK